MKRSFLLFALFAVVVVPFDLPRADAQDASFGGSDFGFEASGAPGISDELRYRLRADIDILRDTSKTPEERVKARESVKQLLTEMFDADVARRREQLEGLQSQVEELKKQLDAQEKSRDELVELRLLLLDREISGKSAFPKEWDALSDMTGHSNDGAVRHPTRGRRGGRDEGFGRPTPRRSGRDEGIGAVRPMMLPITNSVGMELVHIPKGELTVGNRKVAVRHAEFFMGQTEVTQGQWKAVMKTEPWKGQENVKEGDDYPAAFVSYEDTVKFCEILSAKDGKTYRLPTEEEWEYACRAGSTTDFSFGDSEAEIGTYAWFNGNTQNEQFAHQVAKKRPNAWSLYDMHGNVFEWTSTVGMPGGLPADELFLGPGSVGLGQMARGGGWNFSAAVCPSAFRFWSERSFRGFSLGFRVASVPSDPPVEVKALPPDAAVGVGTEVAPAEPRPESP